MTYEMSYFVLKYEVISKYFTYILLVLRTKKIQNRKVKYLKWDVTSRPQ